MVQEIRSLRLATDDLLGQRKTVEALLSGTFLNNFKTLPRRDTGKG